MFVNNYREEQWDGTILYKLIYTNTTPMYALKSDAFCHIFLLGGRGIS